MGNEKNDQQIARAFEAALHVSNINEPVFGLIEDDGNIEKFEEFVPKNGWDYFVKKFKRSRVRMVDNMGWLDDADMELLIKDPERSSTIRDYYYDTFYKAIKG